MRGKRQLNKDILYHFTHTPTYTIQFFETSFIKDKYKTYPNITVPPKERKLLKIKHLKDSLFLSKASTVYHYNLLSG